MSPRDRRDPDGVDDELAFHVEEIVADLVDAGWEPAAAHAEARARFADLERTRRYCKRMDRRWSRRARLRAAAGELVREAWQAGRQLRRAPVFATVVVLTLSLGIGAVAGIWAIVDAVLLAPLPYEAPDRLVWIQDTGPRFDGRRVNVNPANLRDWQAEASTLSAIGGFTPASLTLTTDEGAELVSGAWVTAGLLDVLGTQPILGREPSASEDVPGEEAAVAVLSHEAWSSRFGGAPDIVGRVVVLEGASYEIIGVAQPNLRLPSVEPALQPDFLLPGGFGEPNGRGGHWLRALGRLAPGASLEQARSEMAALAVSLADRYPETNTGVAVHLESLHEAEVGGGRRTLFLFLGAVGLLLVIACVNVAGLYLIRNLARAREFGVRAALGGGTGRVLRQLGAEASVPALLGALGGAATGWAIARWLPRMPGIDLPRLDEIAVDGRILAWTTGLAAVSSLAAVWIPALVARQQDPVRALRSGAAGTGRRHAATETLVVIEVALSVVLVAAAGVLIKSYLGLSAVDPGFRPEGVAVVRLVVPETTYDDEARAALYRQLLAEVRAVPGVIAAGAADSPPFQRAQNSRTSYRLSGTSDADPSGSPLMAWEEYATPGYFEAVGAELIAGRTFHESDRRDGSPVAIVNEAFATQSWPDGRALGRRFGYNGQEWEVVGVVRDGLRASLDSDAQPEMVFPPDQHPWWVPSAVFIVVRGSGDALDLIRPVRDAVGRIAPDVPVGLTATMTSLVQETLAPARLRGLLVAVFATIALLLALLGVYAVLAYRVTLRRREIGLRLALGADSGRVMAMVVHRGLRLAWTGLAIGLACWWLVGDVLSGFIYGVEAHDPAALVVVIVAVTGAAAAASYVPARRATGLDPVEALAGQ